MLVRDVGKLVNLTKKMRAIFLLLLFSPLIFCQCLTEFNIYFEITYAAHLKQFFAVGSCSGPIMYTSSNGISWTRQKPPRHPKLSMITSIASGNNMLVAVGSSYAIVYSQNGVNWTVATTPDVQPYFFHHIRFLQTKEQEQLFFVGASFGTTLFSSNGSLWHKVERDHTPDHQEMLVLQTWLLYL